MPDMLPYPTLSSTAGHPQRRYYAGQDTVVDHLRSPSITRQASHTHRHFHRAKCKVKEYATRFKDFITRAHTEKKSVDTVDSYDRSKMTAYCSGLVTQLETRPPHNADSFPTRSLETLDPNRLTSTAATSPVLAPHILPVANRKPVPSRPKGSQDLKTPANSVLAPTASTVSGYKLHSPSSPMDSASLALDQIHKRPVKVGDRLSFGPQSPVKPMYHPITSQAIAEERIVPDLRRKFSFERTSLGQEGIKTIHTKGRRSFHHHRTPHSLLSSDILAVTQCQVPIDGHSQGGPSRRETGTTTLTGTTFIGSLKNLSRHASLGSVAPSSERDRSTSRQSTDPDSDQTFDSLSVGFHHHGDLKNEGRVSRRPAPTLLPAFNWEKETEMWSLDPSMRSIVA